MSALTFLMDLLARHTGKPVVLLLDEYNAPIQSAWELFSFTSSGMRISCRRMSADNDSRGKAWYHWHIVA